MDENVSGASYVSRRRHNTHARRQRFSFQNASSRRHATREAARRASHSIQAVPPRVLGPAQLVDAIDEPLERPPSMPQYSSLPRELRRPAFRPISAAAIAAVSPELKQVPITFILREIHGQGKEYVVTSQSLLTPEAHLAVLKAVHCRP
jgi:hypothetical protein